MTPIEEFDSAALNWKCGQRFCQIPPNISSMFEVEREFAQSQIIFLQSQFQKGRRIEIHFDFLDSGEFQAVADIQNFLGLVGVCRGAVLSPAEMFRRMLAHPRVLPQIGAGDQEKINVQHSEGLHSDFDSLLRDRAERSVPIDTVVPRDRYRMEFSIYISQIARDFLVLHELGHIVLGHCDWLLNSGKPYPLKASYAYDQPDLITRQAMEIDADEFAMNFLTDRALKIEPVLDAWKPFGKTPEVRLFNLWFAMAAFFRLWGMPFDASELAKSDHPPTGMRFSTLFPMARMVLQHLAPDVLPKFRAIFWTAITAAEESIVMIGGKKVALQEYQAFAATPVREHHDVLRQVLREMRPQLNRFRYIPEGV